MEQRTEEWFSARMGKVTGSKISAVMMKPTTKGYQEYLAEVVAERVTEARKEAFTGLAMKTGQANEDQGRAYYSLLSGNNVEQVGFIDHPKLANAGCSPDGLIGLDGYFELKCPAPHTHIGTLAGAAIHKDYLLQMQWGMECTDREWADFASFCPSVPEPMRLFVERIPRDAEKCEEIKEAVTRFLAKADEMTSRLMARLEAA